jgi:hypothetical protein
MLEHVLTSRTGQIIISVILGLGLAIMFSGACAGRNCVVVRGPNPNQIEGKIYNYNNECYNFKPYMSACSVKKPIKTEL